MVFNLNYFIGVLVRFLIVHIAVYACVQLLDDGIDHEVVGYNQDEQRDDGE